ncbi:MAG: YhfC family intramembrane metalloprotease [Oscillospiraceae bacterium]|nr:YhfC family intramembrane metalloprotease [Oscillospiraceae bacterium]
MTNLNCLLAGLFWLLGPPLTAILWHKKTGARFYPAIIACLVCLPVFFLGAAIRSCFDKSGWVGYYIRQGMLFGILEEGVKYLMLRFHLTSYDSKKDAVTYGIGHAGFEAFGIGMSCMGLIGTGRGAPDMAVMALLSVTEHLASCIALTVLIFWGICTDKWKWLLPVVMLLHAAANMSQGIFIEPAAKTIGFLLTAGECFAAYRCWRSTALWEPDAAWETEIKTDE